MRLGEAVRVAVGLGVGVRVAVGVEVMLGVGVAESVRVAVSVGLGVDVGVRVAVRVGVRVGGVNHASSVASSVGEATTVGVLGASMFSEQPAAKASPANKKTAPKHVLRLIAPAYTVSRGRSAKGGQALRNRAPGRTVFRATRSAQRPQRGSLRMSMTSTPSNSSRAALSISKLAPCSLMVM